MLAGIKLKLTKRRILLPLVLVLFNSCAELESEISLGEYRVTYIVETENGDWFGSYAGPEGEICDCERPYNASRWSYSFSTNALPSELYIEATSEFFRDSISVDIPDVTASIHVNGDLIEITTNSKADGKTRSSNYSGGAPNF